MGQVSSQAKSGDHAASHLGRLLRRDSTKELEGKRDLQGKKGKPCLTLQSDAI
jgi:hypothetical protein